MKISLTETSKRHAVSHCTQLPPDFKILGTIESGGRQGALVLRPETGFYSQFSNGRMAPLNQHDVMRRVVLSEIGAVKSEKKSKSSAKNALLGGRPRKLGL